MTILSCVNLSKLFFLRWARKYIHNSKKFKALVRGSLILILTFIYISFFILLNIYVGIIISRKRLIHRLYLWIRKKHIIIQVILYFILGFIMFMIICFLFTIPILFLMILGSMIEKGKFKIKIKEKKRLSIGFIHSKEVNREVSNKVLLPLKKGYLNEKA